MNGMTGPTLTTANSVVQGNNKFAFDLYHQLARAGASNLFFSPYSVSSALAMTFAGARGRTEQEMASVLRFPTEHGDLHPVLARLNELIFAGPKPDYTINVANRLWGQQGYQFRAEFVELLRTRYGADLVQMDFGGQPEFACREINRWVEDQTAGKIRNLISPGALTALTRLLLINAVYFKGDWTAKFDEDATKKASFHLGLFKKIRVQMMNQQANFSYANVDHIQVLEMPYGAEDLSMVVLLPKRVGGLAKVEAALTASNVNRWIAALNRQTVKVFLPRFCLTEQFSLKSVLISIIRKL